MTRTVAIIAAMFALVLPCTFNYDTARANMVEQTQYHPLPILNPQNFEIELAGQKPVLLLVAGDTCNLCDELARLSSRYPQVKFFHVRAGDFGVPEDRLPVFIVDLPGFGVVFERHKFTDSNLESFVERRVQAAEKQMNALTRLRAVREKVKSVSQPFDDRLEVLLADYNRLSKHYSDRSAAAMVKADEARAAFEDQVYMLEEEEFEARKHTLEQVIKLRKDASAAVNADRESAEYKQRLRDLSKSYTEAVDQLDAMKGKSVARVDAAYVTVASRVEQLWRQYKEMQIQSSLHDEEVTRPFIEQAKTLEEELRSISLKYRPRSEQLKAMIAAAAKPFTEEATRIEKEGEAALKLPLEQIEMVKAQRKLVTAAFSEELDRAMQEMDAALRE